MGTFESYKQEVTGSNPTPTTDPERIVGVSAKDSVGSMQSPPVDSAE